jgi:hypothetical protein
MKRIKWLFVLGSIAAATVVSVTIARGSVKLPEPVTITPFSDGTGYSVSGSLGSVRAQLGLYAELYCRIESAASAPGNGNMIICHAADANNVHQVECLLAETDQVHSLTAAVAAMNGDSYVYFEVYTGPAVDAGTDGGSVPGGVTEGTCTRLKIENGSMYAPKAQ